MKLNTIQNEHPILWDDLIDLGNALFHWKDRIEYYGDQGYLTRETVLELLEARMLDIEQIKQRLVNNDYDRSMQELWGKDSFIEACTALEEALNKSKVPVSMYPEVMQAFQIFKHELRKQK